MGASAAHYEAERAEHLRNADEELAAALGDGLVANELLPPVLNKPLVRAVDEDIGADIKQAGGWALVDAVFNARIEALAALRRFTQNEARLSNGLDLLDLLAADERLEAAEKALKEAE